MSNELNNPWPFKSKILSRIIFSGSTWRPSPCCPLTRMPQWWWRRSSPTSSCSPTSPSPGTGSSRPYILQYLSEVPSNNVPHLSQGLRDQTGAALALGQPGDQLKQRPRPGELLEVRELDPSGWVENSKVHRYISEQYLWVKFDSFPTSYWDWRRWYIWSNDITSGVFGGKMISSWSWRSLLTSSVSYSRWISSQMSLMWFTVVLFDKFFSLTNLMSPLVSSLVAFSDPFTTNSL